MIGVIIMCITIVMEGGCENKRELRDSSRKEDKWAPRHTRGFISTRDRRTFFFFLLSYQPNLKFPFVLDFWFEFPLFKH